MKITKTFMMPDLNKFSGFIRNKLFKITGEDFETLIKISNNPEVKIDNSGQIWFKTIWYRTNDPYSGVTKETGKICYIRPIELLGLNIKILS